MGARNRLLDRTKVPGSLHLMASFIQLRKVISQKADAQHHYIGENS